jgi:hypothetical protein
MINVTIVYATEWKGADEKRSSHLLDREAFFRLLSLALILFLFLFTGL